VRHWIVLPEGPRPRAAPRSPRYSHSLAGKATGARALRSYCHREHLPGLGRQGNRSLPHRLSLGHHGPSLRGPAEATLGRLLPSRLQRPDGQVPGHLQDVTKTGRCHCDPGCARSSTSGLLLRSAPPRSAIYPSSSTHSDTWLRYTSRVTPVENHGKAPGVLSAARSGPGFQQGDGAPEAGPGLEGGDEPSRENVPRGKRDANALQTRPKPGRCKVSPGGD
jgi:hypothetical protein